MQLKTALRKSCEKAGKMSGDGSYFTSYQHNIFAMTMKEEHVREFERGDGNELYGKACAVHSSAMLAYNFFYWINKEHPFIWNSVKYTKVEFERQFPCIKGRKKANMDVVLTSEDGKTLLCIECKFTEPLGADSFKIADAYRNPKETAEIDWNEIINEYQADKGKWYHGGIKQNISHLVALNKYQAKYPNVQVIFYNLLFVPKGQYEDESEKILGYKKKLEDFRSKANALKSMHVALEAILTYRDLFDRIPDDAEAGLKDYLDRRYIQHHI